MMITDDRNMTREMPHNIIIEGRRRMSLSGVRDVESFDDNTVNLFSSCGLVAVRGTELHIEKLNLENGELIIEGKIDGLQYSDEEPVSGGFFSRFFK